MKDLDSENGMDGAENFSNEIGIQSPSNDSFQQSLYIAALGLSLGLTGLVSPVIDMLDDVRYDFDFYHSESGTLIKVLQTLDGGDWGKYSGHPSEPIIIIDGHSAGFELKECPCCEHELLDADHELANAIEEYEECFVFYEGHLWLPVEHQLFGDVWEIIRPYVLRRILSEREDQEEE